MTQRADALRSLLFASSAAAVPPACPAPMIRTFVMFRK